MNPIQQALATPTPVAALAALALFALLFLLGALRARRARPFPLRRIAAYERLGRLIAESIETGRPLHVSLGGGAWDTGAPELVAGLTALDRVRRRTAAVGQRLCATTGSPVALLLAMNLLTRDRAAAPGAPQAATFYGPEPLAYACGAALEGARSEHAGHLLLGPFGDEGLWLAEALQAAETPVLGGTAHPSPAALMQLSVDHAVIGEDLFAAGAYLGIRAHLGSLAAQDWARLLVALAIIAGVTLASLGLGT